MKKLASVFTALAIPAIAPVTASANCFNCNVYVAPNPYNPALRAPYGYDNGQAAYENGEAVGGLLVGILDAIGDAREAARVAAIPPRAITAEARDCPPGYTAIMAGNGYACDCTDDGAADGLGHSSTLGLLAVLAVRGRCDKRPASRNRRGGSPCGTRASALPFVSRRHMIGAVRGDFVGNRLAAKQESALFARQAAIGDRPATTAAA